MIQSKSKKGAFIKPCPCTPGAVSCGYYNLNLHTGCPFSCSYCILQSYLPSKRPRFFSDFAAVEKEVRQLAPGHRAVRIGNGELSDSLACERQAPSARKLLELFATHPQIVFEFKTKSDRVADLLAYPRPLPNIVVSWSLNPAALIRREEAGTASLKQRLSALRRIMEKGFKIGIHFDPLILFPAWLTHYAALITEIGKIVQPGRIAWWSLGALRFPPELKEHIFKRRQSQLFWGELVPGFDGKYRYFKPLRLDLFSRIKRLIEKRISCDLPLYLCMEDEETWEEILPGREPDKEKINQWLYESALADPAGRH